jgi:C-terminal processing protease CtpA/Prc
MSGLWIDRRGSDLFAGAVGKGSPAEQAGIATGDRIEGVEFEALIRQLNGNAGEQVSLGVSRDGARREVVLNLANYV